MALLDPSDTIAAIASPPGPGLRGIVRLSGPGAWSVALTGFAPNLGGSAPWPGRRAGVYRLDGLRPPLPASLTLWRGPRTYTGQDAAEVHTTGSPPLLQLVLAHCLAQGARPAEPGEFTLRAFLSGRIDLTRAEAVLGVIDARTPAQLVDALGQLAGGLASPVASLRDRLLDVLAHLEASLDFVDEPDVNDLSRRDLADALILGSAETAALADRLRGRERPGGHPKVVLVGPPNAGKSRLFNAIAGRRQALVSPTPGTTRDYLAALCGCDGLTIELIDTAGDEPARSAIETRAQALREGQAAVADLLLVCTPANSSPACAPGLPPDRPALQVRTKSDLGVDPATEPCGTWLTSAETGEGLDALRRAIAGALRAQDAEADPSTTMGARCRVSLTRASEALATASEALTLGLGDELVAADLRQALEELGKVVGEVVTDDILDRIFQRFCIGK